MGEKTPTRSVRPGTKPPSPRRQRPAGDTSLPVLTQARGCTVCAPHLPRGPRPLLAGSNRSCLLIIGQAPGQAAHDSGIPWNDRSGDRLREWLGLSREQFYDPSLVALMPMGFCYPGKGRAGDAPPRPECAPLWHPRLLETFRRVRLTVYVGRYAFDRYLSQEFDTQTDAIRASVALLPSRLALPHPSPLNNRWLAKNRWFEPDVVPAVQRGVIAALSGLAGSSRHQ